MPPSVSFAQNGEDMVLRRAFDGLRTGRYVEVGANHPVAGSVSRSFYELGWSGIAIEPQPAMAAAFRAERPRDIVVEAAVTDRASGPIAFHEVVDGDGLSTVDAELAARHEAAGLTVRTIEVQTRTLTDILADHLDPQDDIHFLVIDTEGSEASVMAGWDWLVWRPWVVVIEAVEPLNPQDLADHTDAVPTHENWEGGLLAAGYQFCLFDGLSRFYVAREHSELAPALSVPAPHYSDEWVSHREAQLHAEVASLSERIAGLDSALAQAQEEVEQTHRRSPEQEAERAELLAQITRWRAVAMGQWLHQVSASGSSNEHTTAEVHRLQSVLDQTHRTLSWKVTAPLRAVRRAQLRKSTR